MPLLLSLQSPNILNFSQSQIERLLANHQFCQKCDQKKVYKCMETTCTNQGLICPNCDVFCLAGEHFSHAFTYILPLFKNSFKESIELIKEKARKYLFNLACLKQNLEESLSSLQSKIIQIEERLAKFENFSSQYNHNVLEQRIRNLQSKNDLDSLFKGIKFPSPQEYIKLYRKILGLQNLQKGQDLNNLQAKIHRSIKQALTPIPQKQLTFPEPYFLLNKQIIEFREGTSEFKILNELYTDNFSNARLSLKFDKCANREELNKLLFLANKCRNIYISKAGNYSFGEQIFSELRPERYPNLRQLHISENKNVVEPLVRFFCSSNKIETIHIKIDVLVSENIMKLLAKSKQVVLNVLKNNLDPSPDQHILMTLASNVEVFSLMYPGSPKWCWFPQTIIQLQSALKQSRRHLLEFKTNGIKWQDPFTLRILQKVERLIDWEIPIYQAENIIVPESSICMAEESRILKEICRVRKRCLYYLAKRYKQKQIGKKENENKRLHSIFEEFILSI